MNSNGVSKRNRFICADDNHWNTGWARYLGILGTTSGDTSQIRPPAMPLHSMRMAEVSSVFLQIQAKNEHVISLAFQLFFAHFYDRHIVRGGKIRA